MLRTVNIITLKKILPTIILISSYCLLFAIENNTKVEEKEYVLSERTVREFKVFKEHLNDARDRLLLGNILLAIVPFKILLEKPNAVTTIEIANTNWEEIGAASRGLSIHIKNQLISFCKYEAISQQNSPNDFKFWRKLAESFSIY